MKVDYFEPLARAWARMKRGLFSPFRLDRWLVLAFAAWLSKLGQKGYGLNVMVPGGDRPSVRIFDHLSTGVRDLVATTLGLALLVSLGFCMLLLVLLFLWLSSRGRFVFLHDVAHDRADIVEPWNRYGPQGDSLFLWRLVFGILVLATFVAVGGGVLLAVVGAGAGRIGPGAVVALAIVGALVVVPLLVGLAYVYCFLDHFVVPIMYRNAIGAMEAWRRFLGLFRLHPLPFLLYGLIFLLVRLVLGIGICVAGCLTCCCGFVLLALPYVWAVVLLPFLYTFRAFGPEFLAQFGPEAWSWPEEGDLVFQPR